jgi:hypothetical protein
VHYLSTRVWGALAVVPLLEDDLEAQGADESYSDEQRMGRGRPRSLRSPVAGVHGGVAALSGTEGRWGPCRASDGEGKAAVFVLAPSARAAESASVDDADWADCLARSPGGGRGGCSEAWSDG